VEIRCDALLIDVDGTLLDSAAAVERAWRHWAARWGLDAELVLAACHGRRTADTVAEFLPATEVARGTADLDEIELAGIGTLPAVPGAAALLASLEPGRWAVVTSGSRALAGGRLRGAGLPAPAVMVNGPDLANGKPHPEGYLAAAAELGVDPARCVVLEDAPAGVAAGRAAGAFVIAVTVTHAPDELSAADIVVPDLRSVSAMAAGSELLIRVDAPGWPGEGT
jgi:mannitol-1-/sugar-/sorbitol-6-phosphatase